MDEQLKIVKSHCNICGGEKNHFVLKEEEKRTYEPEDATGVDFWECHEMLKCCGCESISMRSQYSYSEDIDEYGHPVISTTYCPPSEFRQKPKWYGDIDFMFEPRTENIKELLHEIYICLQNNAPRLATMGARSLIEHIMIDKIGDKGSFNNNIINFKKNGFISDKQQEVIECALEAGHAATHRSYKPEKEVLTSLMDIVENLIEMLYINPAKADKISKKTPPKT